ncbi:MAG: MFS transporter, partial [Patescibacteria group bacterium]
FALVNIGFAYVTDTAYLWPLFVLYGLFIGITDGVLKAFVSDLSFKENRGEAFGLYHTVIGFSTIIGNITAGFVWQKYGSFFPFIISAVLILAASILLGSKFLNHNGIRTTKSPKDFKAYRS